MAGRTLAKTATITVNTFLTIIQKLKEFIKNLPKHLNTLKGWIDEFVAGLQAKAILINNVAFSVIDPVTAFANTVFKIFKASAWNNLNKLGVSMLKSEDEIYTFLYNGQNIGQDLNKSQAEEFLKEFFSKIKVKGDDAVKKYLDEIQENLSFIKIKRLPNKTNLRLKRYADEVIEAIQRSRDKKGAVCVIQYKGEAFYGKSFKGYPREELPPMHHLVEDYIKPVHKKMVSGQIDMFGQHGKCAEVDALSQLFSHLEKIYGKLALGRARKLLEKNTISKALEIHKKPEIHGGFKEACKSCNPMLEHFKIIEDLTEFKKLK